MKQVFFVGNGALAVPQPNKNVIKWNAEGGVPYKLIFSTQQN